MGKSIGILRKKVRALEKKFGDESDLVHLLKSFRYNLEKSSEWNIEEALDKAIVMEKGNDITKPYFDTDIKINEKVLSEAIVIEPESAYSGYLEGFEFIGNTSVDPDNNDKSVDLIPTLSGQKLEGGLDGYDAFWLAAVGSRLSPSQAAVVIKKIENSIGNESGSGFDNFYNWLKKQDSFFTEETRLPDLNDNSKSARLRIKLLKGYYGANRKHNKVSIRQQNVYAYTNIDPKKIESILTAYDLSKKQGIKGSELMKLMQKTIADAITPRHRKALVKQLPINLNTKRRISEKEATSPQNLNPLESSTHKISIGSLVDLVPTTEENAGGFYSFASTKDINLSSLMNLEYSLGYNKLITPVGMISSDKGNMLYTDIKADIHVRELFPAKDVLRFMKRLKFPDTFINKAKDILAKKTVVSVAKGLRTQYQKAKNWELSRRSKNLKNVKPEDQMHNLMIIDRYEAFEKALKLIGKQNLLKKLRPETRGDNPNLTRDQLANIIRSVNNGNPNSQSHGPLTNAIFIPGILARYQWYQMSRGKDFMTGAKGDSAFNHYDRLRLNYSKGIVTEGVGPRESISIDSKEVYYELNGKRYSHMRQIPGIAEKVNIFDGATFVSSALFDRTADYLGAYPIYDDEHKFGALKTVIVHNEYDANGKFLGYIEKKHAEFLGIDGLSVFDKDGNLIARMVKEPAYNNEIIIYNSTNQMVEEISDDDAIKKGSGIYALDGLASKQFTLPESSRRIVISPKNKSNRTATGFVQYLSSLNYNLPKSSKEKKALDNYTKTLMGILQRNTDAYLTLWEESGRDRDILWDIIKHQYGEQAEMKNALRSNLNVSGGAGVMHEKNLELVVPQMINNLLIKGALGGRTMDPKIGLNVLSQAEVDSMSVGSHYTFKPGVDVKEGHVKLGSDGAAIFNALKKKSGLSSPDEINAWLEENNQSVLVYRFPIVSLGSMGVMDIESFIPDIGPVIHNHPFDTFGTHTGDNDIDGAEVVLISQEEANELKAFQALPFFKEQKKFVADIDMHKTITPPSVMDSNGSRQTMVDLLQGMYSQGMATNMKSVGTTLSMRFADIEFSDGVIVRPKSLTDTTVMDYAPLSINVKKFNSLYGDIDQMDIVNKDGSPYKGRGEKYLQTSVAHEYTQIVNMAVDNVKSGILVNVAQAKGQLWFTERMFEVLTPDLLPDGRLTTAHLEMLNLLAQNFKYSQLKKMQKNGHKIDIDEFIKSLQELNKNITDPVMLKAHLMDYIPPAMVGGTELKIQDMTIMDVMTTEEHWLMSILRSQDEFFDLDNPTQPYHINPASERRIATHFFAAKATLDNILLDYTPTTEAIDAIETWVSGPKNNKGVREGGFNGDYYGALKTLSESLGKTDLINRQAEYDKVLFGVISKYKPKLLQLQTKHGEQAAKLASALVIRGIDTVYRRRLPDAEALHPDVWKDYMENWDMFIDQRDKDGNYVATALRVKDERHSFTVSKALNRAVKNKGKCL